MAPTLAPINTDPSGSRLVNRESNPDSETNKRRLSSGSEEETIKQRKLDTVPEDTGPVPLYLTVKRKEEGQTLSKTSPFLINKAFVGVGGQPTSIRKLRNGTLLVEAANEVQARKFLKMTSFFEQVSVTVEPHTTLNSSKGIVYCRELLDCSLEEIKDELKSEQVTDAVRIMKKESGSLVQTAGLILTFATPQPPTKIKVGYLKLSVKPYFRNPQRCFKCQKYGHSSQGCRNTETCCRCGQSGHTDKECTNEEHCANCKGKHPSNSRNCKVYVEEREILKLTTLEKLPFAEARKEYKRRQGVLPKPDISYSQAAAKAVQPAQCSSCTVLEGMVRALTEQVATLVHQLGTLVQQPAGLSKTPEVLPKQPAGKKPVAAQPPAKQSYLQKANTPKAPLTRTVSKTPITGNTNKQNNKAGNTTMPANKNKNPLYKKEDFLKSASTASLTKKAVSPSSSRHSSKASAMDETSTEGDDCLLEECAEVMIKKGKGPIKLKK